MSHIFDLQCHGVGLRDVDVYYTMSCMPLTEVHACISIHYNFVMHVCERPARACWAEPMHCMRTSTARARAMAMESAMMGCSTAAASYDDWTCGRDDTDCRPQCACMTFTVSVHHVVYPSWGSTRLAAPGKRLVRANRPNGHGARQGRKP